MASGHKLPHVLSGARRTAWSAILVGSACVLNGCGGGGGSGSDGPPTPPTVTLTSSASSVVSGSSVTLTWSSTDATSCTASGGWSGTKATSGSESIGPLGADATYTLSCSGAGGSTNQSASVTVTVAGGAAHHIERLVGSFRLIGDADLVFDWCNLLYRFRRLVRHQGDFRIGIHWTA